MKSKLPANMTSMLKNSTMWLFSAPVRTTMATTRVICKNGFGLMLRVAAGGGRRTHSVEIPSEENRGVTRWEAMQRYQNVGENQNLQGPRSERLKPDCKMAKSISLTTPYCNVTGAETEYPLAGLPISLVHGGYSL